MPLLLILVAHLFLSSISVSEQKPTHNEPMPVPRLQEMCRSKLIVRAEYKGYQKQGNQISYFEPPLAIYRVDKVLHGKYDKPEISIRYDFHDGSACMEEEGWTFRENLMPKKGSLWLLFIEENGTPLTTYRGDFGRTPAQGTTGIELCKNFPQGTDSIKTDPPSTNVKTQEEPDPVVESLFGCNKDSDCIAVGNSCGLNSIFKSQSPSKPGVRCVCEKSDTGSACRKQ